MFWIILKIVSYIFYAMEIYIHKVVSAVVQALFLKSNSTYSVCSATGLLKTDVVFGVFKSSSA